MAKKNNVEYWEDRIASATWKTYNSLEEKNRDLLDFYTDASKSVKEELYTLAEKYSKDGTLTLSEMHKQNRLTELNKKYEKIALELGRKTEKSARKNMQDGFQEVYKNTAVGMGNMEFSMPNKKLMEKLLDEPWRGDSFSGRLWKNQKKLAVGLNNLLLTGLQQGKTVTEIAVQLHNFMGQGFNNCHRLVRTETMHYLNNGTLQRYRDSGVEKVRVWAALDERTCGECMKYHDKVYSVDKAPILPVHPNCRCTFLPEIDIAEEDIVKFTKDGIIKEKEFEPASDIKEANQYAKDILKINANYKGIAVECANEWNKGLLDMKNKFPELFAEKIKFVGESHERNALVKQVVYDKYIKSLKDMGYQGKIAEDTANRQATSYIRKYLAVGKNEMASSWNPSGDMEQFSGICMNKGFFKNYEDALSKKVKQVEKKWKPKGSATVKGTFDHEFGHQLDGWLGVRKQEHIRALFDSHTKAELTDGLSEYAWNNTNRDRYSEMVAEGWSEYCNNPSPRPIAKEIGETIERMYKEWKEKNT